MLTAAICILACVFGYLALAALVEIMEFINE